MAPRDHAETHVHNTLTKLRGNLAFAEKKLAESKNTAISYKGDVRPARLGIIAVREAEISALRERIADREKIFAAVQADFPRREAERAKAAEIEAEAAKIDREAAKVRARLVALEADAKDKRATANQHLARAVWPVKV